MEFGTYFKTVKPHTESMFSVFNAATISCPSWNENINFENSDKILQYLDSLNIRTIRGNSLVWISYPIGVIKYSSNIREMEDLLFIYITTVVSHYPRIASWDVLNEGFLECGRLRTHTSQGKLNLITKIPNWIEKIFTWAHIANPNAKLFINEYRPQNSLKWDVLFDLVDSLLEKGVPIHGVGIQHHHHLPRCVADGLFAWNSTRKICRAAKQRGLLVHFTETSIWNNPTPGSFYLQALAYKQLAQCAKDEGAEHFNVWSPSDHSEDHWSYSPEDREAGIFDKYRQPKPAYYALREVFNIP